MGYNIAIDGPAGAGKSTIAKKLAEALQFVYVDTGAMYRAMGLYFLEHGISGDDEAAVCAAAEDLTVSIDYVDGVQRVLLNEEDVTGKIRTEAVGNMASVTSKYPAVRAKLLDLQRDIAAARNVIMDGRDIGTTILPDADLKIFLTASAHTRALRRYHELLEKGMDADLDIIEADIIKRDEQDMNRAASPLKQAEDAILVDSSDLSIEEVVAEILRLKAEKDNTCADPGCSGGRA